MLLLAMACLLEGNGALRTVDAGSRRRALTVYRSVKATITADDGEGAADIGVSDLMVQKIAGDAIGEHAAQDDGTSQPDSLHRVRLLPRRLPSMPKSRQGARGWAPQRGVKWSFMPSCEATKPRSS